MNEAAVQPQALCLADEIGEGQARGFPVAPGSKRKVIVLRSGGELHGWLDSCPHYTGGTPMAYRKDAYMNADGSRIVCFSHNAEFDPATGVCMAGACLGKKLRRIPLQVGADGTV
ncbi:MAG: Rieske (2Fe-2S) protein, partial [Pararhodobacter sp.]